MAQEKLPSFVTPAGIAQYPKLTVPDTKFQAEGVYSVKVQFDGEKAQELAAFLDGKLQESIADAKKNNVGKRIKEADAPYSWDDNGKLVVSFKMKASGITKAGKSWARKPALFDAKGTPLGSDVNVGGGSKLIISYTPVAFFTSLIGAGLSMRLEAVQVLDLKEFGGASASNFGFAAQEGFDAATASDPFKEEETAEESTKAIDDSSTDF